DSVGTDSLLVPDVYWNRLNLQEEKRFGVNFLFC
ncbi:hypothetical protein LEP1GSC073_2937, partial [Leptospira noguchii str. Cascata]